MTPAERVFARCVRGPNDCIVYTGALSVGGYGKIRVDGKHKYAHRVVYEELVGPIPEGLQIDHLCRVRACCNHLHLEAVTQRENIMRGVGPTAVNATKTHCAHGHEFSPENTRLDRLGRRQCLLCNRERNRLAYWSQKERVSNG